MRVGYILWRFADETVSLFSRALNAMVFGGSTAQTFSARCHLEAPRSAKWARRRAFVNLLFFWQEDHCRYAWKLELDRAWYVVSVLSKE